MASPTEFQDAGKDSAGPQDVFHTPPEEYSLHSSEEQRPAAAADVDPCAVNKAVDVDDGSQAFVEFYGFSDGAEFADLGKDSDLGFSGDQVVYAETVADVEGNGDACEDSKRKLDEIRVSESDFPLSDEFPVKKLKLSEQDLGFDSSDGFIGAESQKGEEEAVVNRQGELVSDAETETPSDFGADFVGPQENVLDGENVEIQDVHAVNIPEAEKLPCAAEENKPSDKVLEASAPEENKPSDEVLEDSGTKEEKSDSEVKAPVLPPSTRASADKEEKRLESEEEGEVKEKNTCFTILKFLAENDEAKDVENLSTVELLRRAGVTFPCPIWWPENYESFNTSGLLVTRDDSWRE